MAATGEAVDRAQGLDGPVEQTSGQDSDALDRGRAARGPSAADPGAANIAPR